LDELERFEEAKYCYNKTIELNPQFIQNTSKYMSESFCNLKLLEKAIEYYEVVLKKI
jgi:tetratricopeptide (TPR) repeat protein